MNNTDDINLIYDYHHGLLNDNAIKNFNHKLTTDSDFKALFEDYTISDELIKLNDLSNVKSLLDQFDYQEPKGGNNNSTLLIAISTIFLASLGGAYYFINNNNTSQSKQDNSKQILSEIKTNEPIVNIIENKSNITKPTISSNTVPKQSILPQEIVSKASEAVPIIQSNTVKTTHEAINTPVKEIIQKQSHTQADKIQNHNNVLNKEVEVLDNSTPDIISQHKSVSKNYIIYRSQLEWIIPESPEHGRIEIKNQNGDLIYKNEISTGAFWTLQNMHGEFVPTGVYLYYQIDYNTNIENWGTITVVE